MRRVHVASLPTEAGGVLDAERSHYLLRVLRLPRGTRVLAFDGAGEEVEAEIADISEGRATLRAAGPPRAQEPSAPLHLVLALPKGPAMDLAVRMATELGATDIHPVLAARSVATGDRVDRWERVAEAAARQCHRADIPRIHAVVPLARSFDMGGVERRIALPGAPALPVTDGPVAVWVGPEGGWTSAEIDQALAAGCAPTGLGRWVLRADTAVAAALARTRS